MLRWPQVQGDESGPVKIVSEIIGGRASGLMHVVSFVHGCVLCCCTHGSCDPFQGDCMPLHFLPTSPVETSSLVPAFRDHPSRLFVETSGRCNLNCLVCIRQNHGNSAIRGDMELATFDALKEVFPRLDALVLNGIGEPLLNHHLEMFISQAKKYMPGQSWIGFQTNGNLLSNLR